MPHPDELGQKILELEERVRILQLENDHLAERAEDTLLLGLIAEQISMAEDIGQVLECGLERISVLKDVPFCACCLLTGNRATIVKSYLSFSDEDVSDRTIVFPETVLQRLAAGDCSLSGDECGKTGICVELKAGSFVPLSAICIPFRIRYSGANIFFFGDNKSEDRLYRVADMLHRVAEMMTSRIDNINLFQELQALNSGLDRKVEERTRELQESENRFRQFFENQPAYCYMISPEGLVLDVNKSALEVLGYEKEDIIGRPLQTIYAPECLPKMMKNLEKWKATGKLTDVEIVILSKGGEKRTVLLSADVVKDAEGNVIHSVSVQQDITERKRLEQERLAHLRFFESMDRINRAIHGTNDLDQMMRDVLDVALSIFDCDRAWLFYPCDPDAATFRVSMEIAKPEYPGAKALNMDLPMPPDMARNLREALESVGPVTYIAGTEKPINTVSADQFGVKSMMMVALYPKSGKPWEFCLHQCSYPRVWTSEEERLFQEIGRRLADVLTNLLSHRGLEASEAKYRRIVETATEGIWVLGPDNMTTSVNVRMAEMLGYSCEEMIGRAVTDFMFDSDAPDHLRRMENHHLGLSENYERRFRRKDGRIVWAFVSATPIFDVEHHFKGFFAMFTDITERKRAEKELRQYREHLEDLVRDRTEELEKRTQQLETANIHLQEADRLKSIFLASMSHELRTPLNSIIGFTGIMLMGISGDLSEEQKKQLMMVKNSANHLLGLINDVLDIAKIEAGRVTPSLERFEIGEVVASVVETVLPMATEKGLEFVRRVPPGIMVVSDKRRVSQILVNIVGNAVKFTEHGSVTISAGISGDKNLELRFTDTGIGIREQDMNKLFSPFQQIDDSLTKAHEGTGLGLYLCKKLAILLGGSIGVTSKCGKGSEFTVFLPLTHGGTNGKDTDR